MIINFKGGRFIISSFTLLFSTFTLGDIQLSESLLSGGDVDANQELLVLTPTQIGQSIQDTPGSVTVLTREELLNRGISTVPEALRLVPGMSVNKSTGFNQESGHDYHISYHGGSARIPRRLQVQVDGMSVYLGGLSKIDWTQLPVTVHDIEHIEVIRNPSVATYGANSFSAMVNIVTRHPNDIATNEVFMETGTRGDAFMLYRLSGFIEENAISFRASSTKSHGYDYGSSSKEDFDRFDGHRDSMGVDRISLRLDRLIVDRTQFTASAGVVSGDYHVEYVASEQEPMFKPDIQIHDWFLNVGVSRIHSSTAETRLRAYTKSSNLEQDFRACTLLAFMLPETFNLARKNQSYFNAILEGKIPSGGTTGDDILASSLLMRLNALGQQSQVTACGTLNQDYLDRRHHLTIEHHRVVGDTLTLIGGATVEHLETESETFFNGKVSQSMGGLFFSSEWKPATSFTFNAGLYLESSNSNININPLASINWHVGSATTWRIVASRAYRSPDLAETERDWRYKFRDVRPIIDDINSGIFVGYASSEHFDLEEERIDSIELGVFIKSLHLPYSIDIRAFYEKLDNLISEKPTFSNFTLSNNGKGTISGAEATLKYDISQRVSFDISYSHQHHDYKSNLESGLNAEHQGQAALVYTNSERVITVSYVGNSKVSHQSIDQWSLTWMEKFKFEKSYLDLRTQLQYMPSEIGYAEDDIGQLNVYGYDDDTYVKVSLDMSF